MDIKLKRSILLTSTFIIIIICLIIGFWSYLPTRSRVIYLSLILCTIPYGIVDIYVRHYTYHPGTDDKKKNRTIYPLETRLKYLYYERQSIYLTSALICLSQLIIYFIDKKHYDGWIIIIFTLVSMAISMLKNREKTESTRAYE